MALIEEFEKEGNWLFRWRSYLPGLMAVLCVFAIKDLGPSDHSGREAAWELICLSVSLFGQGIRVHTIGYAAFGTSGRNTTKQKAAVVNTSGMYSVVRHPLYLGNYFMWLGVSLYFRSGYFMLLVTFIFWLYYERIMFAEEAYLRGKFGGSYLEWAAVTPAFIPRFSGWRSPSVPFNARLVLKREYNGLMAIVAWFVVMVILRDLYWDGRFELGGMWLGILAVTTGIFITLLTLKKTKAL